MVQGFMANQSAERSANRQYGLQQGLVQRQTAGWDALKRVIDQATAAGMFDPTKQISQQNAILDNAQTRDLGNQAGAARTLGYRPGDTAPLDSMRATSQSYNLQKQSADQAIINNAWNAKMAAYGALNSGSSSLNPGIGVAGQQQALALGQMQNPGNFLGALMPYLMGMGRGGGGSNNVYVGGTPQSMYANPPVDNGGSWRADGSYSYNGGFGG